MREDGKPSARTVLKPCPCCGGEAHFRTETALFGCLPYQAGYVICMDCGMRTRTAPMDGFTGVEWTEEDFAALWNRRAGTEKIDLLGGQDGYQAKIKVFDEIKGRVLGDDRAENNAQE